MNSGDAGPVPPSRELDREILALIDRGAAAPRDAAYDRLALELFRRQFDSIAPYREFCRARRVEPACAHSWKEIPAVPTTLFRRHRVASFPPSDAVATFRSSGTSSATRAEHSLDTTELYDRASLVSFRDLTPPPPPRLVFLSLIPSPPDAPRSSLAHMVDRIAAFLAPIRTVCAFAGGAPDPGLAAAALLEAQNAGTPLFLAATAVALADLLEALRARKLRLALPAGSRLFETGGRKGRRYVAPPGELARLAQEHLGIGAEGYLGEYGMAEISSPSWGTLRDGRLLYRCPSWAPVTVVDPETLAEVAPGEEGLVRIFDPANRGSVSALLTGDWGRRHEEGFEVVGRAVDSELRGCSLSVAAPPPAPFASDPSRFARIKEAIVSAPAVPYERRRKALGRLTESWLDRTASARRNFEEEILAHLPLSPGGLREGLDRTFAELTEAKLPPRPEAAPAARLTVHVHAGNLPVTGVFDFYRSVLSGSCAIHRPSARAGNLAERLHADLCGIDAQAAARVRVVATPSHDDDATRALFQGAGRICAQGDEQTLAHLSLLAPSGAEFVPHGPKLSAALLASAARTSPDRLDRLLHDIFIWEQQGCLSPQILFVLETAPEALARLVETLQRVAESRGGKWKRRPDRRALGRTQWQKLAAEIEGDASRFYVSPQLSVALVSAVRPDWFSTPGFVQLVPLERPGEMSKHLAPFRAFLGSLAADEPQAAGAAHLFPDVVPLGALQAPPF